MLAITGVTCNIWNIFKKHCNTYSLENLSKVMSMLSSLQIKYIFGSLVNVIFCLWKLAKYSNFYHLAAFLAQQSLRNCNFTDGPFVKGFSRIDCSKGLRASLCSPPTQLQCDHFLIENYFALFSRIHIIWAVPQIWLSPLSLSTSLYFMNELMSVAIKHY